MKKLLLLIVISVTLWVSSCQIDDTKLEKEYYSVPFTTYKSVPIIKAKLNGKKAYFLIDTGASTSLLDITMSDKYGFTHSIDKNIQVYSIGGSKTLSVINNDTIVCCGETINIRFKGSDLSQIRRQLNIVGIVGADYLNRRNLIVDFENNVLRAGDYEKGFKYSQ